MKVLIVFLIVFFMPACASLIDSKEKPQLYQKKLVGAHSVLASCVVNKLQSDGRSFMRILQFRNLSYSDMDASEIYALDTRYLQNLYPTNSPSNPDAVLEYADPNPEILPSTHSGIRSGSVYAFALLLKKIDDTTVNATLRGDQYVGSIAWNILLSCAATAGAKP